MERRTKLKLFIQYKRFEYVICEDACGCEIMLYLLFTGFEINSVSNCPNDFPNLLKEG